MATSTAHKPSAKSNLDIAKAIATLQEQVKELQTKSESVPKQDRISDRDFFSIMFSIMIFISIFTLTFTFFYFNKLDNKIDKLDAKIDVNHKQILDILLKQSK